jgi:hypothetical protein
VAIPDFFCGPTLGSIRTSVFKLYFFRAVLGEVWVDAVGYWKFITGTDRRARLDASFNTGYRVKHPVFAPILALCRPINFTNPII